MNCKIIGLATIIVAAVAAGEAFGAVPAATLPGQGEDKLYDGKLGPTCSWAWEKKPIEIITDFGETREISGVRFWAGRSWISKGVKKASFYRESGALGDRALPGNESGALGDHPNVKIVGLDLRDRLAELPETERRAMRAYSTSYLEFTAIRSKRYHEIAPLLTDAERRMLAMWIDLCIPYCSNYTERHTWSPWHQQRYLYTYDKRIFSCWLELDEIRKSLGLPSVPLTGVCPERDGTPKAEAVG